MIALIINITIFSNVIGALAALFFMIILYGCNQTGGCNLTPTIG